MAAVGVDFFIDGLVLGLGFAAGRREGLLLTIALTIEILFLGLTVTSELTEGTHSRAKVIGVTAGLALHPAREPAARVGTALGDEQSEAHEREGETVVEPSFRGEGEADFAIFARPWRPDLDRGGQHGIGRGEDAAEQNGDPERQVEAP